MRIKIKALDTLFFRDGKPFERGDESWADGIFPPPPSVLYGALRSWYITNSKDNISESLIEESGKIKIKDIHYKIIEKKGETFYFPLPLDLVEAKYKKETEKEEIKEKRRERREKTYQVEKLNLDTKNVISSFSLQKILTPTDLKEVAQVDGGLILSTDLENYLKGSLKETKIRKFKDYFISEAKVGIGRDNLTHTVEEGKLYRVDMRRLKDIELVGEFSLPKENSNYFNVLKLGGESKSVSFEEFEKDEYYSKIDKSTVELSNPNEFKIYLVTPALFENGFEPNLKRMGIEAQLVSAAIGKPLHIGGFDMVKGKPKSMFKAIPAGSVYYYKTQEPAEKIIEKLHAESISDYLQLEGFGIAYIGNY